MIKTDKIIKTGLFLIMLLPLVFTPFTFFPWHFGKTMIFQIIVEVLVFFWLWQKVERSSSPLTRGELKGGLNWLDWSIFLFLAIITITGLTGVNPANSFWGNQARANGVFTWLHFGAFYFLLKNYFSAKGACLSGRQGSDFGGQGNDKWIIVISIAVAALVSLTAIFSNILPANWQSAAGGGIIGNRAFLAGYLILVLGLISYLIFLSRRSRPKVLLLAAGFVLVLATLLQTGTRGAAVGLAAGILSAFAILIFILPGKKLKIGMVALLFIFGAGFFMIRQSPSFAERFPLAYALTNFSYTSGTGETRLMAWQEALQGLREKPILGWGWGNYEIIFNRYYNPQFLKYSFAETVWDKPHNWLLDIADSAGVMGLLAYLSIFIVAFYYLFQGCRPEHASSVGRRDEGSFSASWRIKMIGRVILTATLIAYFVQDLFLFETTNGLILWFGILALISAHSKLSFRSAVVKETWKGRNTIKKIVLCSLFFVLLFSLYRFNFVPLRSSYFMRQAELSTDVNSWSVAAQRALAIPVPFLSENAIFLAQQFTQFDKAGAVSKDAVVENTAWQIAQTLNDESKKYPDNLALPVWEGQVYLVEGERFDAKYYVDAERALNRALAIAPQKQEVLFLLVQLYLLKQDTAQAIDFSQKAVDVAPDIGESHWFFGLANVASGYRPQGLKSIEKAIELGYGLTADHDLYVLDLYALEKNYPKLIEEYKKRFEVDPENVNWLIKLATVYAESGDKKAALETTRQAVGLFPPLKAEAEKFIEKYNLLEK